MNRREKYQYAKKLVKRYATDKLKEQFESEIPRAWSESELDEIIRCVHSLKWQQENL